MLPKHSANKRGIPALLSLEADDLVVAFVRLAQNRQLHMDPKLVPILDVKADFAFCNEEVNCDRDPFSETAVKGA